VIVLSLTASKPFLRALGDRPAWVLVHTDELYAVLVRNDPRNAAVIEARGDRARLAERLAAGIAVRLDALDRLPWWRRGVESDVLVFELYALTVITEPGYAVPLIQALYARYPDYRMLHEVMYVSGGFPMTEIRPIRAHNARWPTSVKQVLDWANTLVQEGNPREALAVLQRGRWFFPLSPVLRDAVRTAPVFEPTR
jgi:hypothetical protein